MMNLRRVISYPFIFILYIPFLILITIGCIGELLLKVGDIGNKIINTPKWFLLWVDWIKKGDEK
jgi:hypothetical protein